MTPATLDQPSFLKGFMKFLLSISLLFLFPIGNAHACGWSMDLPPTLSAQIDGLRAQIEAKFTLTSSIENLKCGAVDIILAFDPAGDVVPKESLQKRSNDHLELGRINSAALDTIPMLERILALPLSQVEKLKEAAIAQVIDAHEIEAYGLSAYAPAEVAEPKYAANSYLLYVTLPHCTAAFRSSSTLVGYVYVPIFTLDAFLALDQAPLYQRGDSLRAILASPQTLQNVHTIAKDNHQAQLLSEQSKNTPFPERKYDYICGFTFDGRMISWDRTLALQPPAPGAQD